MARPAKKTKRPLGNKKKTSAKKSKKFQYRPRTSDEIDRRAQQSGGNYDSYINDGIPRWRPADGPNVVRILPPTWDDADHYGYEIFYHRNIGAKKSTYLCHAEHKNVKDPMDIEREKAEKRGDDDDYIYSLKPTKRVGIWLIDRKHEERGPQFWDMPWRTDKDLALQCKDITSGETLSIDSPYDGWDVVITKSGSGRSTEYAVNVSRKQSALSDDEETQDAWLEFIMDNPIPSILRFYSLEYLEEVYSGIKEDDDEDDGDYDEDDDELPFDEDEDADDDSDDDDDDDDESDSDDDDDDDDDDDEGDDDDEDEDDEDDDEDEVVDDDDDEDDDDEDEEEERPRRKAKPKPKVKPKSKSKSAPGKGKRRSR